MKLGLGSTLKELRKERNLTQKNVALFLRISRPTYVRYERDLREIPLSKLIELTGLFHFDLLELISELEQSMRSGQLSSFIFRNSSNPNRAA
jgi:transcriptional regulator with XRE-family HTH domain